MVAKCVKIAARCFEAAPQKFSLLLRIVSIVSSCVLRADNTWWGDRLLRHLLWHWRELHRCGGRCSGAYGGIDSPFVHEWIEQNSLEARWIAGDDARRFGHVIHVCGQPMRGWQGASDAMSTQLFDYCFYVAACGEQAVSFNIFFSALIFGHVGVASE